MTSFHNFAGGAAQNMLTDAGGRELVYYDKNFAPYNNPYDDPDQRNYYVKRTNMFVAELFSEITKNNLRYLPCNFSMLAQNPNVQPTLFITPSKNELYVYFSNVTGVNQNYTLDPTALKGYFTGATGMDLGAATIYCVQASRPYSTSGKSTLYNYLNIGDAADNEIINICYDPDDHDYPIEIVQITQPAMVPGCSGEYAPNGCVTVLPYTTGYFKMSLTPHYPERQGNQAISILKLPAIHIYPNPTGAFFSIIESGLNIGEGKYNVRVYNIAGLLLKEIEACNGQEVDISEFPEGSYQIRIETGGGIVINEHLVKI